MSKSTSGRISKLASEVLTDRHASKISKSLAGSALAQRNSSRQTGAAMEDLASKVLRSDKYSESTKELAGSILSQSIKDR